MLGSALLNAFLDRRWVERELDTRALRVTPRGRRELHHRFRIAL